MRRLLVKIGAWLAILLGLAMMLQPTAAEWLSRQRNSKTAQQFAANTATAAACWGWIPPPVCRASAGHLRRHLRAAGPTRPARGDVL